MRMTGCATTAFTPAHLAPILDLEAGPKKVSSVRRADASRVAVFGLVSAGLLITIGCHDGQDGAQTQLDASAKVVTATSTAASPLATEPATRPTTDRSRATPTGLEDLLAGHNDPTADRINLVFAPWGWDDEVAFREFAQTVIGWDGHPVLFSASGSVYPLGQVPDEEDDMIMGAELGLFGYEPFRSRHDLFNIWVTTESPPEPYGWLDTVDDPDYIDDQVIITLALVGEPGHYSRSGLDTANGNPDELHRTTDPFANVTIAVWLPEAQSTLQVIPHELGHALFGLPDEYLGSVDADVGDRNEAWPSCAASIETAEAWWGDLIGEYDPMIDTYIDEMVAAGFEYAADAENIALWRDRNRTAYVEDGCYGVTGSYRSTEDSLMGRRSTPAFGLTNRRWMEQVLALWSGT
jgi:hypothetical protein